MAEPPTGGPATGEFTPGGSAAGGRPASALSAYRSIVRGRVRSQTAFRASFALELGGSLFLGMVEFAEVYAVFGRTKTLGGFDYHAVMLMFGFSALAFGLADLCVGHVENLPTYVRTGTFEAILLRPLSALGQLGTSDFSLRRLGRSLQALVVLVVALRLAHVHLTPARVLLIIVTPLLGAVIYGCVFVAAASVSFWYTDAGEFANAFTYGGNYVGTYPFSIYGRALRQFFTFVVPVAFVAYVPTLVLLGRLHSAGWPAWSAATPPLATAASVAAAAAIWRTGIRRYVGAGG